MRRYGKQASRVIEKTIVATCIGAFLACGSGQDIPALPLEPIESIAPVPNILLVSVDTLRADHMSAYGYERETTPWLRRAFRDGTIFERAYAAEANTSPSMMSCLTGLLPYQHGVRFIYQLADPAVPTVADYLNLAGYQTAAVVSNVVLSAEAMGLDRRFDYYDDLVDEPEPHRPVYERRASRTTDAAIKWLATVRNPNVPSFFWVHYIDPHGPYTPPKNKPVDFGHGLPVEIDLDRVMDYVREAGVTDGLEYVDRYDEEIAYTDREVQRLLQAYEQLNAGGESLVIFTADHGESMMDRELWFAHGHHVYEELTHIPLMIKGGAFTRQLRIDTPVSIADIAPTILESAGLHSPPGIYGTSLSSPADDRVVFAESTTRLGNHNVSHRSAWVGFQKWTLTLARDRGWLEHRLSFAFRVLGIPDRLSKFGIETGEPVYYDLQADPGELRGRAANSSGRAMMELAAMIENDATPAGPIRVYSPGQLTTAPKVAEGVSDDALRKLRSLGYVQ